MQAALFIVLVAIAAPVFAQAPAASTNLRVEPGDGSLVFTWDDPNDPSITGYEFRLRVTNEQPDRWRPDWTLIPNSDATTTTAAVYPLANDTNFTLGIRAVRGNVKGDAAHVTATPRAPSPPRPPVTSGGESSGGSSRDRHGDTPARATLVSLGEGRALDLVHHRTNQHKARYRLFPTHRTARRCVGGLDYRLDRHRRHGLAGRRGVGHDERR